MALTKMGDFTFDHAGQADTPVLTPTQLKAAFDSRGINLKTVINNLIDALEAVTDDASGADQIGMTAITETGAAATVQAVIEALITRLKAVTNSASGADLIGATAIASLGTPNTVQGILEALAPMTTEGDIMYQGASAPVRLAKGTSNQLLTMNSGGTAPEWKELVFPWQVIADTTLSSTTMQVDFEGLDIDDYKFLKLITIVASTVAQANLRFNDRVTSGDYEYRYSYFKDTATVITDVNTTNTYIGLECFCNDADSSMFNIAEITINNYSGNTKQIIGNYTSNQYISTSSQYFINGKFKNTNAINKISIYQVSGGFVSGSRFILMGVK